MDRTGYETSAVCHQPFLTLYRGHVNWDFGERRRDKYTGTKQTGLYIFIIVLSKINKILQIIIENLKKVWWNMDESNCGETEVMRINNMKKAQ